MPRHLSASRHRAHRRRAAPCCKCVGRWTDGGRRPLCGWRMVGRRARAAVESCLGTFVLYKASAQHPARERSGTSAPRVGWHPWVPWGPAALPLALLHSTGLAEELFPLLITEPAGRLDHLLLHPAVYINQPCADRGRSSVGSSQYSPKWCSWLGREDPWQPCLGASRGDRPSSSSCSDHKQKAQGCGEQTPDHANRQIACPADHGNQHTAANVLSAANNPKRRKQRGSSHRSAAPGRARLPVCFG